MHDWHKSLILIRGLPGSGKSTLASEMFHDRSETGFFDPRAEVDYLVEADDYHMVEGEYQHEEAYESLSHAWCLSEAFRRLRRQDVVYVANVFSKREYIFPYLEYARKLQVQVLLVETETDWAWSLEKLYEKNVHDVPLEVIERMRDYWEEMSQEEVEVLVGRRFER